MDAHDQLLEELKKWQGGADAAVEGAGAPAPPTVIGDTEGWTPDEDTLFKDPARLKAIRDARKTKVEIGEPVITSRVPQDGAPPPPSAGGVRGAVAQSVMGAQPAAPREARLPVDTSRPLGYQPPEMGAPPVDTAMRGAQAQDDASRRSGRLGQAVTAYTERPNHFLGRMVGQGGGTERMAHNPLWDDQAQSGDRAVADLMTRRQSAAGMLAQQSAASKVRDAKDPNSETARTYRAVLAKFAPDLKLDGATPEQMEKIAPWLEKFAAENTDALKATAAIEEAKKKAALHEKERGEDRDFKETVHRDAQDNAAATRALAGAARLDRSAEAKDVKDQAGAQHLGDKAGETQSAAKALDAIDATIAQNPDDIPGVGKWKSKLPDFAANALLSDEGLSVRNNARDVLGTLLHKRSGAAVSPAELARYEQMYGLNGDEAGFKAGVARMRRDFAAELAATQAGVSEGAKAKFKAGGGILAEDVAPKTGGSASIDVVDKNGQHYHPPPEDEAALRAELKSTGLL